MPATLEHSAIAPGAAEAAKADPPKLIDVITPTKEQKQRLLALGLDMTEHGGEESLGVVLHGAEDEAELRKAGLRWRVKVSDLVAQDAADRAASSAIAARAAGARASALPSGRTTYRTLADYNAELKDLAAKNPNLVKLFTMPEKTYGGKDVLGHRDHRERQPQRRQAGLLQHGRPPRPRVAGRASSRWSGRSS